ncbi:MAG: pseudouridine synthase [Flavonifractor plautii]
MCEGIPRPPEGRIDAPIGRVPGSLMARQVDPVGQPASTRYRVLRTGQGRALVELELDTGRTHQIRVHMAQSATLTGDFLRHGGSQPHLRPALHSARLPPPPRHREPWPGLASAGGQPRRGRRFSAAGKRRLFISLIKGRN